MTEVRASRRVPTEFALGRFPFLTLLLCAIQIGVFVSLAGRERVLSLDSLIGAGAKVGANIMELGETWRLITANFLHRDVLHLGFNTFFLLNVGGTMENVYRGRDYLLIVVASGLGTTVLSFIMSPVPSVGASGIVLGFFGSASVFGYKYGHRLPPRYRRYFGWAILPYALFILYVGLTSRDTDNWGHVGGLVAGGLVTLVLTPRHFPVRTERRRSGFMSFFPLALGGVLLVTVLGLGPVIRAVGPRLERFQDPSSGLAVAHPVRWRSGSSHLGDPAWGNRLGVTLGLRAERRQDGPFTVTKLRKSFLDHLHSLEDAGDLTNVRVISERPFFLEGGRGLELDVRLESRAGPLVTRNILIERGYYGYRVVLSAPRRWFEPYLPVFRAMIEEIRMVETRELQKARREAEVFPGMSSAQVELGDQLSAVGEVESAARAYQRALNSVPDLPRAIYGLAQLNFAYGGDLEAAERATSELWSRRPDSVSVVTLLADLRKGLGRINEACDALSAALERMEEPPAEIRGRLASLKCTGGLWMEP